ncbi:6-bladed beta-propeller, partial [Gemmatimonadota bacterium]
MRRLPCVSALIILLTACSSPDEIRTHSFSVFEENGVTIAESTGGPKYEGELFTYEEVLTLQQDTTRIESLLFRPEYFIMDEEGYFYIADVSNYRIAVFDREGRYSHQIGREGRGPGEFRYPRILTITGGTIAIQDMFLRRTSVFTLNGALERDLTASVEAGPSPVVYPGPDLAVISINSVQDRRRDAPLYQWHQVVTTSANGDTLGVFSTQHTETGFSFSHGEEGGVGIQSRLYGGRLQAFYSPGRGILTTTGQESEFQFYGVDGRQRLIIRADVERTPVTDEEGSAILETFRGRLRSARNERSRTFVQRQLE